MNAGVEGSDVTGASGDNISVFPPWNWSDHDNGGRILFYATTRILSAATNVCHTNISRTQMLKFNLILNNFASFSV